MGPRSLRLRILGWGAILSCACQVPAPPPGTPGELALDRLLATHPATPLQGDPPPTELPPEGLRLLLGGHLYGNPAAREENGAGQARSLLRALPALAQDPPDAFVSMGDFFRSFQAPYVERALADFAKLGAPLYNAPGNHDVRRFRSAYEERFGRTFGGFRVGANLFLVLDTELSPWRLEGEQLRFLEDALALAPGAGIRNVFAFGHRVLFAAEDPRYEVLFRKCNSRQDWSGTNYRREVLPLIEAFLEHGSVYWCAGDVGVAWSYGLFYEREGDLHYLATGLGGTASDNLVELRIAPDHAVQLERLALDADERALEDCGLDYWRERFSFPPPE